MKNFNFISLFLIFVLISCQYQSNGILDASNQKVNSIDNYRFWGEAHNKLLEVGIRSYNSPDKIIGNGDAKPNHPFDEWNELQKKYVMSMQIDDELKPILCDAFDQWQDYYDPEILYEDYFKRKNGVIPIIQYIKSLKINGQIDNFECNVLCDLASLVQQYKEGLIGLNYLKNYVDYCISQWDLNYGPLIEPRGHTTGYVLAISQASLEWWSDANIDTRVVPAWLGADVGGAIVGAGLQAADQYLSHGRIVSWKKVGCHALAMGVIGSTGIANKIGGWVIKFF